MFKFVKSRDMFGHRVTLNFNSKGNSHTTLFGGVMSIVVQFTMLMYFLYLLKHLFLFERDNIETI